MFSNKYLILVNEYKNAHGKTSDDIIPKVIDGKKIKYLSAFCINYNRIYFATNIKIKKKVTEIKITEKLVFSNLFFSSLNILSELIKSCLPHKNKTGVNKKE